MLYKFLGVQEPLRLLRVGWSDLLLWVTMFSATLGLGMIPGMAVGVAASALTLIQRFARSFWSFVRSVGCREAWRFCCREVDGCCTVLAGVHDACCSFTAMDGGVREHIQLTPCAMLI